MANPYTTWVKGVRRTAQQAWTVARSNLANIGLDYVTSALETIIDLDAADGTLLPAVTAQRVSVGTPVAWTSSVETGTDENAQKIIFVDLDDPLMIWNLDEFMQAIQGSSWHTELGDPPMHGAIFVTEDSANLIWWNRETGAQYMKFTGGGSNLFRDAGQGNSIAAPRFLDGKIYTGGTSNIHGGVYDLVADKGWRYTAGGTQIYIGDIADRDSSSGWITTDLNLATIHNTVNAIGVCRHSELVDAWGRPKHIFLYGTEGGLSCFQPNDSNTEDNFWDYQTTDSDALAVTPSGQAMIIRDNATRFVIEYKRSLHSISADSWTVDETWQNNSADDGTQIAWTDAAIIDRVAAIDHASLADPGAPMMIAGSEQGAYVIHPHGTYPQFNSARIRLHEDYAGPYEKGECVGSWPMHAVTDITGKGYDWTNNNAVTFASGGPAGSYATLDGVNQSLSLTDAGGGNDMDGMQIFTISYWLYMLSLPAAATLEYILSKYDDTAGGGSFTHKIDENGVFSVMARISAGNRTLTGPTLSVNTWYYITHTLHPTGGSMLWVNAEWINWNSATGAVTGNTYDIIVGGLGDASGGGTQEFANFRIGGLMFQSNSETGLANNSEEPMTRREIEAEYRRGLLRNDMAIDTNDTISDNDVAAVAADPHGRFFALGYDDRNVDIFNVLSVLLIRDAYPGTTLRDVAVKSMPGGKDPHYIMGGSDQIEFVQPDTRILAR